MIFIFQNQDADILTDLMKLLFWLEQFLRSAIRPMDLIRCFAVVVVVVVVVVFVFFIVVVIVVVVLFVNFYLFRKYYIPVYTLLHIKVQKRLSFVGGFMETYLSIWRRQYLKKIHCNGQDFCGISSYQCLSFPFFSNLVYFVLLQLSERDTDYKVSKIMIDWLID